METSRPISTRLNRGTLLMTHPRGVNTRFANVSKTIRVESLALIVGGLLIAIGGLLVEEGIIAVVGLAIASSGFCSWVVRGSLTLWRRSHVPTLLFISSEGVGAIMPDSSSIHVPWDVLQARFINYSRLSGTLADRAIAGHGDCGLLLMERSGGRIYVTRDLTGYEELLAILADYRVPIAQGSFFADAAASRRWRGGFELSTGASSN